MTKSYEEEDRSPKLKTKFFVAVVLLSLVTFSFQHCSNSVVYEPSSQRETGISLNNGQTYDGKLYLTQELCDDSLRSPKGKIYFSRENLKAVQTRDFCLDLENPKSLNLAEIIFVDDKEEVFTLKGEVYHLQVENPEPTMNPPVIPNVPTISTSPLPSPPPPPTVTPDTTFDTYYSGACSNGYCNCQTQGTSFSCGATDGVPDQYCKLKGFVKAAKWTCADGIFNGQNCTMTTCFNNRFAGNYVCDKITCTNNP